MNNLVVKAYQEMKKNQADPKPDDVTPKHNPSKKELQSAIAFELIQKLQLLIINLPHYKESKPDLNVRAYECIPQIKQFAKIHGDQLGRMLKSAIYQNFSYVELKNIWDGFNESNKTNIAYAYSKLQTYFDKQCENNFSFAYDVLSMLCEFKHADLISITVNP